MSLKLPFLPGKDELSKLIFEIFRNLLIVYLLLLIFDYLSTGNVGFYFDLNILLYLLIVIGALSLVLYAEKLKKLDKIRFDKVNMCVSITFLLLFSLFLINQISLKMIFYSKIYQTYLITITILFGVIGFSLNRDEINSKDKKIKDTKEKFNIPSIGWFLRWMDKEGWFYSFGLSILVILGFWLRVWNLGVPSFGDDELITVSVAKTFLETGKFDLPTGIAYGRSWVNIFFIALSIRFFGLNEFSARLPSVLFGTLTIILVYFLCRKMGSKSVGFLAAILICLLPWQITWSREARMYAQAQAFYLIVIYLFYLIFEKTRNFKLSFKDKIISLSDTVKPIRNSEMEINIKWAGVFLLFLILSFFTHESSMLFVFAIYSYALVCYIRQREHKYLLVILSFSAGIFLIFFFWDRLPPDYIDKLKLGEGAFFIEYLLEYYPIITITGLISVYSFITGKNKLKLLVSLGFIIPLLITNYFLDWEKNKYIYFLFPLLIISSSYFFTIILKNFIENINFKYSKLITILLIIIILYNIIPITTSFKISQIKVIDSNEINLEYSAMIHPDWKGLRKDFNEQIQNDEVIISTLPLQVKYYFGKNDYWIRKPGTILESSVYMDSHDNFRSIYEGSIWVSNYSSFMDIIKNNRGYIIVDYRWAYSIPKDVKNYVEQNMTIVASSGELNIYRW